MIILDTSALIRFFTKDDPVKAAHVKQILESGQKIVVPEVVLPEIEYVLTSLYGATRSDLIEIYQFLVTHRSIKTSANTKIAVDIFQKTNLDMADSLILASSLKGSLLSFDQQLLKAAAKYKR